MNWWWVLGGLAYVVWAYYLHKAARGMLDTYKKGIDRGLW